MRRRSRIYEPDRKPSSDRLSSHRMQFPRHRYKANGEREGNGKVRPGSTHFSPQMDSQSQQGQQKKMLTSRQQVVDTREPLSDKIFPLTTRNPAFLSDINYQKLFIVKRENPLQAV